MVTAGLSWIWLAALLPGQPAKAAPPPPPLPKLELLRPKAPTPAQRINPGAF